MELILQVFLAIGLSFAALAMETSEDSGSPVLDLKINSFSSLLNSRPEPARNLFIPAIRDLEPVSFPEPRKPTNLFIESDQLDYNFTFFNTTTAFGDLGKADSVDLLFLVDITGSMGSYIRGVKESIIGIVKLLTNETDIGNDGNGVGSGLVKNLRLSFVGYRDFDDDPEFVILDFTKSVNKFVEFVQSVAAAGGGDAPEDVFGGMERALMQNWTSDVRVLLHIADAPCHGVRCGNRDPDPQETPLRKSAEELFQKMAKMDVGYNFGVIKSQTKMMVKYFEEISAKKVYLFDLRVDRDFSNKLTMGSSKKSEKYLTISEDEYKKVGTRDRYGFKVGNAAFSSVVNAINLSG